MTAKQRKPQGKKAKTLRQFTFDAGDSNSGAVGIVISVAAYSKRQATRLANAYLSSFAEPVDLPVPAGYKAGRALRHVLRRIQPHAQGHRS